MKILLNIFLTCYALGVFFYPPLYNVGFYGIFILILLQFKKEKRLRNLFLKFNQEYRLWIIVSIIILMAFVGCFYTVAPQKEAFIVFLRRFLTLSAILAFIPFFIQYENFMKKLILFFTLSGALYCVIATFYPLHRLRINPIPISMLVGYIVVILSAQILLRRKDLCLYILRFIFFALFLICFNPEKTGVVASIASIASIAKRGLFILGIIATIFGIGIYGKSILCYRLNSCFVTLFYEIYGSIQREPSSIQRINMQKQCLHILKTSPFWGNGTASYGSVIKKHSLNWISWGYTPQATPRWFTTVHPHNDFWHWCVQFGYIGGSLYLIFMGYFIVFFIKKMSVACLPSLLGFGTLIFFGVCSQCDMMLGSSIIQSVFVLGLSICIAKIVRKEMLFPLKKHLSKSKF